MSLKISPPPITNIPPLDRWLSLLFRYLGGGSATSFPATALDYTSTMSSVSADTTLTDATMTVLVTATGKTITMPLASAARIGRAWNVIFGTTGTCTVAMSGSNTFPAPTSATETSVILNQRGQSVIMRCTSATTWGLD